MALVFRQDQRRDEVTHDGELTFVKLKNGTSFGIKFIDDTPMLVVAKSAGEVNKDALETAAKGKSALKSTPAFISMYNKPTPTTTMWGLIRGDSKNPRVGGSRRHRAKRACSARSTRATDHHRDVRMRLG